STLRLLARPKAEAMVTNALRIRWKDRNPRCAVPRLSKNSIAALLAHLTVFTGPTAGTVVGDHRTDIPPRCPDDGGGHPSSLMGEGGVLGLGTVHPLCSGHLPPKEVLKHLQVCQEGTHLMLERSPPPLNTSFLRIFK